MPAGRPVGGLRSCPGQAAPGCPTGSGPAPLREAAVRARAEVVAGNGYHVYLRTVQPDLRVEITIRIWDGPEDPPTDAEGWTGISLESETGELVVSRLTLGPAGMTGLPRPGVYVGHAWWNGRRVAGDCSSGAWSSSRKVPCPSPHERLSSRIDQE